MGSGRRLGSGVALALFVAALAGCLTSAAEQGSVTFGAFAVTGQSVGEGRRASLPHYAYGQVVTGYGMRGNHDPMRDLTIEVAQERPFVGDVSIHIADTLENLNQVPRIYDLYQPDDRRKAPYATVSIHGVRRSATYNCEPRRDRDDAPVGRLILTSLGGVGGNITGTIEVTEGWAVPADCRRLGVAAKGIFKVTRAADYEFD